MDYCMGKQEQFEKRLQEETAIMTCPKDASGYLVVGGR